METGLLPDPLSMVILAAAAFVSAVIGSVAGSGGTAILLPAAVLVLGIHAGIPAITIANFSANASRVALNWREVNGRIVAWFLLGALPLVCLSTWLFTRTSPELLVRGLGVFMLAVVAWRRLAPRPPVIADARVFAPLGAGFGLLYGFVDGLGPLMAPFFLGAGLLRGAYIGTDALATVSIQGAKLAVFGAGEMLVGRVLASGLLMVPFMVLGTWLGKRLLARVSDRLFTKIVEASLLLSGIVFLVGG